MSIPKGRQGKLEDTEDKYILIGAGPSGLAMAKNLKDQGIAFDGFEADAEVGGLWNIKNENSTVYESAHLISSKSRTEFSYFPMKKEVADYPHHSELLQYFKDFAAHFQLYDHYYFNERVTSITRNGEVWNIETASGKKGTYKGLIIANGSLSHPNIPTFKGEFSGEILHSCKYKNADIFHGKRVLIIGAGNSGCDIAVDAVHRAQKVDMSLRRGYHFVPKYVFGKPADTIGGMIKFPRPIKQRIDTFLLKWFTGDPTHFGFPKPDHKMYESHPIVNSLVLYYAGHGDIKVQGDIDRFEGKTVFFKDGKKEDYDLILLATGYKLHYPFIDIKELNWGKVSPDLYLNIFHPNYNNLFLIGMVEAAGIGWQGRDEQAQLVAKYIKASATNPKKYEAFNQKKAKGNPDMSGGYAYVKLDRMAYYVHNDTYRKLLKKGINMF